MTFLVAPLVYPCAIINLILQVGNRSKLCMLDLTLLFHPRLAVATGSTKRMEKVLFCHLKPQEEKHIKLFIFNQSNEGFLPVMYIIELLLHISSLNQYICQLMASFAGDYL